MTARETLKTIRERTLPQAEVHYRASDFLSETEQQQLREANQKTHEKPFDEIDAFCAEIVARFGLDAYRAWLTGEIEHEKMLRWIAAERARQDGNILPIMATIVAANAGANNPDKNGHAPKSLRSAQELIKQQQTKAKGH